MTIIIAWIEVQRGLIGEEQLNAKANGVYGVKFELRLVLIACSILLITQLTWHTHWSKKQMFSTEK